MSETFCVKSSSGSSAKVKSWYMKQLCIVEGLHAVLQDHIPNKTSYRPAILRLLFVARLSMLYCRALGKALL